MKLELLAAAAVIGSLGLAGSANAQSYPQAIYAGGSTLASKVYRQLFDCWGMPANQAAFPLSASCSDLYGNPSYAGDTSGLSVQILYAPVGSGAGKRAFDNHDGSNSTATGLGTPAASNTVPYTSAYLPAYGYPTFHFASSESLITQIDVNLYNSNGGPANYGAILQIPAFSTTVTIPFNGKDGNGNNLTINTANLIPTGGSSGLNLSRQALCGIFTGHITKWDNPILTALNGGTPLGSGAITVVHRADGDGETFLLVNALVAQCAGVTGRNSETDATPALYQFKYTDRGISTARCDRAIPIRGAYSVNWPDLVNDQCGQPIAPRNTGGGTYLGASGSSGVVNAVTSTYGAIGYVSPDFVQPVVPYYGYPNGAGGLATANLQSQYDIDNNTGAFQPPTVAGSAIAMSAANPTFDDTSIQNPVNWSRQGVVRNPLLPGSYPISGFSWLDFYQCYKAADLTAIQAYVIYHYTDYRAQTILNANGFAPITTFWVDALGTLLFSSASAMGNCGVFAGQ